MKYKFLKNWFFSSSASTFSLIVSPVFLQKVVTNEIWSEGEGAKKKKKKEIMIHDVYDTLESWGDPY